MFDMLAEAVPMLRAGQSVALATVTSTQGSSPREPGASMLVPSDGGPLGSVSGGCVEGAVYTMAQQVLVDHQPVAEQFGFSDDDAFAVGLTCGGILDVFISELTPADAEWAAEVVADVTAGRPVAVATVVAHPDHAWLGRRLIVRPDSVTGTLGSEFADHGIGDDARGQLASGVSGLVHYGPEGERMGNGLTVFVASFQPKPRMLIFGAVDFAGAVADQAGLVGFHTTVCDAREVFATRRRFSSADEVVVAWPHRYVAEQAAAGRIDPRTAVCVLTHDAKFDVPLIMELVRLSEDQRPFYIGVMGSRRTHAHRLERLREAGITDEQIALMHSPIGLDLKGRTPAETAVSILAEVIATRWGGSGESLARGTDPIHSTHVDRRWLEQ